MITVDKGFLSQTPFAFGGEGLIFEHGKNQLIKIYKPGVNMANKQKKVEWFIANSLPANIIKPLDTVYCDGKFVGFVMNKVDGQDFERLSNKKFIKANNIKLDIVLKMLVDIKNILKEVHSKGIRVGDFNDCNIIFDEYFNVYFIDCDSWDFDVAPCEVCMDSFKDPDFHKTGFTRATDVFAYCVMLFKSIAKIHPFGGTTTPDMNIIERINKRYPVIGHSEVIIPRTIQKWDYMPPKLLENLKQIFETSFRELDDSQVDDFRSSLKFCDNHNDFYYGKFTTCPVCDANAKVQEKPKKVCGDSKIPLMLYMSGEDIRFILSLDSYIDKDNNVVHSNTKRKIPRKNNYKYYFSDDGAIVFAAGGTRLLINSKDKIYKFEKKNQTDISVVNNECYFVDKSNTFVKLTVSDSGNHITRICKCTLETVLKVDRTGHYFICNDFTGGRMFCIDGMNTEMIKETDGFSNYGIHYDSITNRWLFVFENDRGQFFTYVLKENKIEYFFDNITYSGDLANICFNNGTIFTASNGAIRGFMPRKNVYKDFPCDIVTEDSRLVMTGKRFAILNGEEVYLFG